MTPNGLMKRALQGRNFDRYYNPQVVKSGDRQVFEKGIAPLLAQSDEVGCYRPDPELDGNNTIAERIARKMNYQGAEAELEIAASVVLFTRLGLLNFNEIDGSISLNMSAGGKTASVVGPDTPARTVRDRLNGMRNPGQPRKVETPEDYQARKQRHVEQLDAELAKVPARPGETEDAHRLRQLQHMLALKGKTAPVAPVVTAKQPSMSLPIAGGRSAGSPTVQVPLADVLRSGFVAVGSSVTQPVTHSEPNPVTQPEPTVASPLASVSVPLASPGATTTTALENENIPLEAVMVVAREAGATAGEPTGNPLSLPTGNPPSLPTGNPPSEPTGNPPATQIAAMARQLAQRSITVGNYGPAMAKAAPAMMLEHLKTYSVAEIEFAIDNASNTEVQSANYYIKALAQNRREALAAARPTPAPRTGAASSAPSSAPMHPKLEAQPSWHGLTGDERAQLTAFLKAMDRPTPAEQHRAVAAIMNVWRDAYEKVARKYPEIRAMADYSGEVPRKTA